MKQRANYENTKELAKMYAKSEGVIVFIYRTGETYNFVEIGTPESQGHIAIEYISPLQ